ncbi:MAG: flavoprotein [Planctomycetota bacterium]
MVLIVTGSVAAYKAAALASDLAGDGLEVHTVLSEAATHFVRPLLFQSLTGRRAYSDMWESERDYDVLHVSLADRADVVIVAPATASLIGRYACGIANDLPTCVLLATAAPVVVAPAMNDGMWRHPAVRENVRKLQKMGVAIVGPETGRLACGREGHGRLAAVGKIKEVALGLLAKGGGKKT